MSQENKSYWFYMRENPGSIVAFIFFIVLLAVAWVTAYLNPNFPIWGLILWNVIMIGGILVTFYAIKEIKERNETLK